MNTQCTPDSIICCLFLLVLCFLCFSHCPDLLRWNAGVWRLFVASQKSKGRWEASRVWVREFGVSPSKSCAQSFGSQLRELNLKALSVLRILQTSKYQQVPASDCQGTNHDLFDLPRISSIKVGVCVKEVFHPTP